MTTNSDNAIDWPSLVFSEEWMRKLDKLAARRFGQGGLAEEATTYVIEQLSADSWGKCKTFKGDAKPQTFLHTLSSNYIEEFARKRFGRPRPPSWLQRQGDLWVRLWKMLCLERQMVPAVVDRLSAEKLRESEFLDDIIRTIKARIPTCGEANMEASETEDIGEVGGIENSREEYADFDQIGFDAEHDAQADTLHMLAAVMNSDLDASHFEPQKKRNSEQVYAANSSKINNLSEQISLSNEERLMLRMIYQDGMSRTAVSQAMGLQNHQAGRIVSGALERIADVFKANGLDLESLLQLI